MEKYQGGASYITEPMTAHINIEEQRGERKQSFRGRGDTQGEKWKSKYTQKLEPIVD